MSHRRMMHGLRMSHRRMMHGLRVGYCRMIDIVLMDMRRGVILLRGATGVAIVASARLAVRLISRAVVSAIVLGTGIVLLVVGGLRCLRIGLVLLGGLLGLPGLLLDGIRVGVRVLLDVVLEHLRERRAPVSGQGGIALLHGCCNVLGDGGQVILRHLARIHLFERDDGTVRFLVIFPGLDLTGRCLIGRAVRVHRRDKGDAVGTGLADLYGHLLVRGDGGVEVYFPVRILYMGDNGRGSVRIPAVSLYLKGKYHVLLLLVL